MEKKLRNHKQKKHGWLYEHRIILVFLVVAFIILSSYSFLGYRVPILDEGVYIGMGKHMFSGGEIGFWERFRPLGLPIITGIGWSLGFDPYLFSKIIALLFATTSILFVYLIAEKIFNKKVALISSLLLFITPLFFYYSDYVLTDMPSMFFILVGIYFLLYNKYFLAGVMGGFGFLFKFTEGLFFIALILFLILILVRDKLKKNRKHSRTYSFSASFREMFVKGAALAAGFLLILVPYMIFNYILYHPTTPNFYDSTLGPIVSATMFQNNAYQNLPIQNFTAHIYNWTYYLINLFASSTFLCLIYIFFFAGIYLFLKEKLYRKTDHLLLALIFLTYLIYFTIIPYKQLRFVYFFVPIAAIYSAFAITKIYAWLALKSKMLKIAFIMLLLILALISLTVNSLFYSWKFESKPPLVTDLYEYFENNDIQGTIATGDMVLAAYTDNSLTNLYELRAHLEGKNPEEINAVFHADYTYPCLDEACIKDRNNFFNELNKKYELVKQAPCYSGTCYIYLKK
ncbi:MAG: ArnT family glycosyltransferase [Candidatus Nanoarchaeia archaeon]